MVVFDKSITLSEKMNEYDKESLKAFAVDLGLRKLSQLKKADLVAKIVEKLLDPATMFYRASILTDKEIAVFEKGFDGPVVSGDKDFNAVGTLNEMDLIVLSNRVFFATPKYLKMQTVFPKVAAGISSFLHVSPT